jgi:hypothetical protein
MPKVKSIASCGFHNSVVKTVFMPSLETTANYALSDCKFTKLIFPNLLKTSYSFCVNEI